MTTVTFPYRCALITGASSGIGEALARSLAGRGVHLVLVARTRDRLERLAAELNPLAPALALPLDITLPDADLTAQDFVASQGLQVDLLVNNAGFGSYGPFAELPGERDLAMIDLNVKALVRFTHRFLPQMVKSRHGAIVNISSLAGFQPLPFMATYAATKAFVTSFTLALAGEVEPSGVRVLDVCPGRTRTNFRVVSGSLSVRIRSRVATPEKIARITIRALLDGRLIALEGLDNRLLLHLQRWLPRRTVLALARRIFSLKSTQNRSTQG